MRAEFRIWHDGNSSQYAMYEPGSKKIYCITDFAPASEAIRNLMPKLMGLICASEILRKRLFAIEFLATTNHQVVVSMIYHKAIDDEWVTAAESVRAALQINIIGRSKKRKIILGDDYITETLQLQNRRFQMRQIEATFTQPNAKVNEKMVAWACEQAASMGGDLLELYCGNGNFTLPLSQHFNKVLTTEVSKGSIKALIWNLQANNIKNVELARLSAEETCQALDRVRPFRRLAQIDLDSYNFNSIFVDPPRAGVDKKTMEFVRRFEHIIYISCNPETLATNIEQISDTHRITAAAAFDQFPFTPHLEAGLTLRRK